MNKDNIVEHKKFSFKMFNDQNIKYSCIIQNKEGDTICRMMRDDAPNNAVQQYYAEGICKALNEYADLKSQNSKLLAALKAIEAWPGNLPDERYTQSNDYKSRFMLRLPSIQP